MTKISKNKLEQIKNIQKFKAWVIVAFIVFVVLICVVMEINFKFFTKSNINSSFQSENDVISYVENKYYGQPVKDADKDFQDRGYEVYFVSSNGYDNSINVRNTYNYQDMQGMSGWLIYKVYDIDINAKKIFFQYALEKQIIDDKYREKLESNFSKDEALKMLIEYGKENYGESFDIIDQQESVTFSPIDEHTWYISCFCIIKNENDVEESKFLTAQVNNIDGNENIQNFEFSG